MWSVFSRFKNMCWGPEKCERSSVVQRISKVIKQHIPTSAGCQTRQLYRVLLTAKVPIANYLSLSLPLFQLQLIEESDLVCSSPLPPSLVNRTVLSAKTSFKKIWYTCFSQKERSPCHFFFFWLFKWESKGIKEKWTQFWLEGAPYLITALSVQKGKIFDSIQCSNKHPLGRQSVSASEGVKFELPCTLHSA